LQSAWTDVQIAEWQAQDESLAQVYTAMKDQKKPTVNDITAWSADAKRYWQDWERLRLVNGVLRRAWFDVSGKEVKQQLIVPRCLVKEVLTAVHDNQLAGHFAERRTLKRLREQFYWSGMAKDVRLWCRSCVICCARRSAPSHPHHALQQDPVSEPLQRIAVDILGSLEPATPRANKYILVVVDYLTKWSEAYALPNQTAETVALKIVEEFVCRFGIPEQLHSDQGRQFESELFTEMCKLLGIKKTRTTPLHPQSDGQTERMNRTLLDVLAKLTRDNPNNWDNMLAYAMSAYRSSVHSTTNETPNRLMLGREVSTPATLLAPAPPNNPLKNAWVDSLHRRFQEAYKAVLETTRQAHRVQKAVYDRRAKLFCYEPGNKVWLYDPKPRRNKIAKLDAEKWDGPYVVQIKISGAVYLIKKEGAAKGRIVNVDRLAPYVSRDDQQFPSRTLDNEIEDSQSDSSSSENDHAVQHDTMNFLENVYLQPQVMLERYVHVRRESVTEVDEPESTQSIKPLPITTRARRQTRQPAWMEDYDKEVD
jgi:hypothetical protein